MDEIAYYGLRNSVRPGVTGWAQVRYGYANNLEEETEKMRYDLFYIKNRSLWLDSGFCSRRSASSSSARAPAKSGGRRRAAASWCRAPSPAASTTSPAYMPWLANSTAAAPPPAGQR